jgi:hypothetical protein
MLLADRKEEHQEFFEEGQEAEFVDLVDEMVDKLKFYSGNEPATKRVAKSWV